MEALKDISENLQRGDQQAVVELVRKRDQGGNLRIIVGGAPLSRAYAEEIGADSYSYDAAGAVELVKSLMGAV